MGGLRRVYVDCRQAGLQGRTPGTWIRTENRVIREAFQSVSTEKTASLTAPFTKVKKMKAKPEITFPRWLGAEGRQGKVFWNILNLRCLKFVCKCYKSGFGTWKQGWRREVGWGVVRIS